MHSNHASHGMRRLPLIVAIAAMLWSTAYAGWFSASSAQAAGTCTVLGDGTDSCENDNTVSDLEAGLISGNAQLLVSGVPQTHSISPAGDADYVKFHLDATSAITLATSGPGGKDVTDTELWLYDSSQTQIDFNQDATTNNLYSYIQRCGPTALAAGDYYAKVDKRKNDAVIASYNITLTVNSTQPGTCIPNTAVVMAGQTKGSYWVHQETASRQSYSGTDIGPVRVLTYDKVKPLIATNGIFLKKSSGYESYTEFIGVPNSRLKDTYYFPWYSNATNSGLVTQLCFANVGTANTNVTVTIGTLAPIAYNGLGINKAQCVSYTGVNNGPVKVKSSGTVPTQPIVASLNTMMGINATYASYAEFGGLSASDVVSTDYMFPVYNNRDATTSYLRYTNIGSASTKVTVLIRGIPKWTTYSLGPNQSKYITIPNLNAGPVHVQSSNSVPISASMVVELKSTSSYASYAEFVGLPGSSLTDTRIVFPWYNNATNGNLVTKLRINNVGTAPTNVSVTIGGNTMPTPVSLPPGQSKVVSYTDVNNGPVVLQSSSGIPILASESIYLKRGRGFTSYSEYIGQLGLPKNQLQPTAWFPWYSFASWTNFVSELRFSLPARP